MSLYVMRLIDNSMSREQEIRHGLNHLWPIVATVEGNMHRLLRSRIPHKVLKAVFRSSKAMAKRC